MMPFRQRFKVWLLLFMLLPVALQASEDSAPKHEGFSQEQVMEKAGAFFGETTKGLASAIEKVFEDQGEPNAIVVGEEVSAAIVVGLRYGRGELQLLSGETRSIFWQGPSVGFDMGGNASKVFTLIYNLKDADNLYQRFPGVEGSVYYAAGVGVNYLRSGDTVVAPIRTGVGLRTGANVGYLQFTKEASWNPF